MRSCIETSSSITSLLAPDGHIKIIDFGTSKKWMGAGDTTSSFVGTSPYMAPEVSNEEIQIAAVNADRQSRCYWISSTGSPLTGGPSVFWYTNWFAGSRLSLARTKMKFTMQFYAASPCTRWTCHDQRYLWFNSCLPVNLNLDWAQARLMQMRSWSMNISQVLIGTAFIIEESLHHGTRSSATVSIRAISTPNSSQELLCWRRCDQVRETR